MLAQNLTLDLAQLIRAVHVNKTQSHSFFLGAGSSISSGIKSAYDCIWEWKRLIFLTSNPGLETLFPDASVQATRFRIQNWLDAQGKFPKLDSPEEYTFFADAAYPIPSTRKSFFQNISKDAKPSAGYHLLSLLTKEGIAQKIWTTNFDQLVAKASASYEITTVEIGLDSTHRIERMTADGELVIHYLHGDYRYDQLKNTSAELQAQDVNLRKAFVESAQQSHLIVTGFSGRDRSIMEAFTHAYSKSGSGRLYWTGYGTPAPEVVTLIDTAVKAGREAYYIDSNGFDDLLMRLGKFCLSNENYKRAEPHFKRVDSLRNEFSPFALKTSRINSVIKSNLLPIAIPVELFQFQSSLTEGAGVWKRIREAIGNRNLVAAPLKGRVLALGTLTDIMSVFQTTLSGEVTRTPVDHKELSLENGTLKYIFNSALTIAIAERLNYSTDKRRLIWGGTSIQSQNYNEAKHEVYKAVLIELIYDDNGLFMLLKPTVKILRTDGEPVETEVKKLITKQISDRKYNGEFNHDLDEWRTLIFGEEKTLSLEFPKTSGSGYTFVIQGTPLFAKVERTFGGPELTDNPKYYKFNAIQFEEPGLLFSSQDGQRQIMEVHPLKGLTQYKPFDFSLTSAGLSKQTTLGVICPSAYSDKFHRFLSLQHGAVKVMNTKENYSIDYPGYSSVYGIALNIPTVQDPRWQTYQIDPQLTPQSNGRYIAEQIKSSINRICSSSEVSLIIICVPTEWSDFTSYAEGKEVFDLHDHVKAFAIQKGVTTQFLEEDTLDNSGQANRIHWWLSLSMYVKTMRTPWVLQNLDANTAFAGIGYSIDYSEEENHIVIGCSHIYNSRGEGLRYRLAKVERPIYRDKRPHLSYEDAYQFGVSTVQLFVEASHKMPERVVVHKRTFFTEEEKRGILDGLKSISAVDLIEINMEDNLRFISSVRRDSKLQADGYPVSRGICIQLNTYTGLLYTHGTTPSIKPGAKDFMGGRGIPAPLVIKKHYGPSSLETISNEILALTKMNWNSASLYSKLPATIQSSNDIARIGSMLSRFSGKSHDYRLFI
jgi:hypothetical protein